MGYVHKTPAMGRSYDSDRRALQADIARIDRERNDGPPGSVVSSDEARLVIPGPLADSGRDGLVLTWVEDLHQPRWLPGGGMQGFTRAESGSNYTKPSGTELYFEDYTLDTGWNAGPGEAPILDAPTGSYLGVTEDGWYGVRGYFSAVIGTVDRVRLRWCTNGDQQGGAIEQYQTVMKYGTRFESSMWVGPVWLPAAAADFTYPIGVFAEWTGASFPTIGTSGVTFDVWRLG